MKKIIIFIIFSFVFSFSYANFDTSLDKQNLSSQELEMLKKVYFEGGGNNIDISKKEENFNENDKIKSFILQDNEKKQNIEEIKNKAKQEALEEIKKEMQEKAKRKKILLEKLKKQKEIIARKKRIEYLKNVKKRKKVLLDFFKKEKEFKLLEIIWKNIVKNNERNLDILKRKISFLDEKIDLNHYKLKPKTKRRIKILFKIITNEIIDIELKKQKEILRKKQIEMQNKDEFYDLKQIINIQNKKQESKNNVKQDNKKNDEKKNDNNDDNIEWINLNNLLK